MAAFMELCGLSSPAGKEGVLQSTLRLLEKNCRGHPQKEEAYKKRASSSCESPAYNAQVNFWKNYEFFKKKMLMGSGIAHI